MNPKLPTKKEPKQTRTVVAGLSEALMAAQESLKNYHPEEPVTVTPNTVFGRVFFTLYQSILTAMQKALDLKIKDPNTKTYIHYEAFPQDLYDTLNSNYPVLMESVKELGFEFYMTHNGEPHPMVKFTLEF